MSLSCAELHCRVLPAAVLAADGTPFRWALYSELEGPQHPDPSPTKIRADLAYVERAYGADRSYLRIGGEPVLFVWAGPDDRCGMNARWKAAGTLGFHVVLERFQHFAACPDQPRSWHDHGPATRVLDDWQWSVSVSPGPHSVEEARQQLDRPRPVRRPVARHLRRAVGLSALPPCPLLQRPDGLRLVGAGEQAAPSPVSSGRTAFRRTS